MVDVWSQIREVQEPVLPREWSIENIHEIAYITVCKMFLA